MEFDSTTFSEERGILPASQPATWLAGLQEFHEGMIFISMTENWVKARVDPLSGPSQQILTVHACKSSLNLCVAGIFSVGKVI